jgi:hypothetical protein
MVSVRACQTILMTAALLVTPAFASRTHRAPTSGHKASKHAKHVSHVIKGQRQIDPDRAREIQTALIRENYLSGQPTGQWDADSQTAMQKYQSDHGWQTKLTPDSRALIKLGLGPNHSTQGLTPPSEAASTSSAAPAVPAASFANTLASAHSIQN